jgi:Flavodoxin
MDALVVFESMYGNTAAVGEAIAGSLRACGLNVQARLVSEVDPVETADVDLLLVGGPTHVHGMSRASTRKTAANDETNTFPDPTLEPGLKEWLRSVSTGESKPAAAFDTRIDKPVILTGSAAKGIARLLESRGFRVVVKPESFFVTSENQLVEGQLEHAAAWAEAVAKRVTAERACSSLLREDRTEHSALRATARCSG